MDERVKRVVSALKRRGFEAEFIRDKETARRVILERIPIKAKVGIPGSKTVRQLELDRLLRERGQVTYDHWLSGLGVQEVLAMRRAQLTSDVLLVSANAVTEDGEIYNMDGIGNRIAPMIFGAGEVIIVIGINKLVKDLDGARERLRKVAGPRRAKELGLNLRCVKSGECEDCHSPGRICRAELILHYAPILSKIRVYIIGEELGN